MNKMQLVFRFRYYIIILAVILVLGISNLIWLSENTLLNAFDMSGHLTTSLIYYNIITHPTLSGLASLMTVSNYYPPLLYIITAFVYVPFGTSPIVAVMTNMFFLAIIAISVFETGKEYFNEKTGLIAAFMTVTYPVVIGLSRMYLLDIALFCAVWAFLLFFIKSRGFSVRRYSVAAGLMAGLGMLTKWTFAVFLLGPVIAFIVSYLWKSMAGKRSQSPDGKAPVSKVQIYNAILAAIVFTIIVSMWYVPNFSAFQSVLFNANEGINIRGDTEASVISQLSYLMIMINFQTFIPIFILFLLGTAYALYKKENNAIFLIASFTLSYLLLSVVGNKDMRYSIPLLGYVSLLSTYWIFKTGKEWVKATLVAGIIVLVFLQFIMAYYAISISVIPESVDTPAGKIYLQPHSIWVLTQPGHDDWKVSEIDRFIDADNKQNNNQVTALVCILPDHIYFSQGAFAYWAYKDKLNLYISGNYVWEPERFSREVMEAKYVVTKDRFNGSTPGLQKNEDRVMLMFHNVSDQFIEIKTMQLPDGSNTTIYKKM